MEASTDAEQDHDPELAAEQAYIDRAYEHMAAMRERAASVRTLENSPDVHSDIVFYERDKRLASLSDDGHALCFGRIDEEAGPTWYVGRRHVEDSESNPVVVEWRAPVAIPFYRASHVNTMGLARRRQFMVEGRTLLDFSDDVFADMAAAAGAADDEATTGRPAVRGRDALLRELDRERTGSMRDIVATIQAEQDEIIRSSAEGVVVVQGGPGTGKTAVGLHRAAFLLYDNEVLERAGVLVIGPNRTFLRYIAQVLPSLDVAAVAQLTTRDLVRGVRLRAVERAAAARVKGDARMADVIVNAIANHRRPLEADLELRLEESRRVTLTASAANEMFRRLASSETPHNPGRDILRDRLLAHLYDRYLETYGGLTDVPPEPADIHRQVRAQRPFQAALTRMWPSLQVETVLRELYTNPRRLAAAAEGILEVDEQEAISRAAAAKVEDEPWTDADVALFDETRWRLDGRTTVFGHIVVDEAQDLTPMQLRMLGRRCPSGSMTILGDIAQGTGVWAHDSWDEVLDHLPTPAGVRHAELLVGYRAPAQVIELASRLLPVAAPQVQPVRSVRAGATEPTIAQVPSHRVMARTVIEAETLARTHRSLAVVVPDALVREVEAALGRSRLDVGDAVRDGLDHRVTVVPARESKGLEFDAVIVVEPHRIVSEAPQGLRLLYVCLTRATKHLSIVHSDPLPEPLTRANPAA